VDEGGDLSVRKGANKMAGRFALCAVLTERLALTKKTDFFAAASLALLAINASAFAVKRWKARKSKEGVI